MKTIFVLNACSPIFQKEVNELNHFHQTYCQQDAVQAWIISEEATALPKQAEQLTMPNIQVVEVKEMNNEEEILQALLLAYKYEQADCILFPSDNFGTGTCTRLAVRTGGTSCTSVIACKDTDIGFTVNKSVFANNLIATFSMKRKPYCFSIAKNSTKTEWKLLTHTVKINPPIKNKLKSHVLTSVFTINKEEASLEAAEEILAIGRGIKTKEKLEELKQVAKQHGFDIGVSRPITMNGWIDLTYLIGASGKLLSPKLCIAAGVSGSQAFAVGIRDSEFIVSVNQDPYAPIHKIADVSIVDDYQEVLKELFSLMERYQWKE